MDQGEIAPDLESFLRTTSEEARKGNWFEYVASPYWHPEERIRKARTKAAILVTMELMQRGINAISPVGYSAAIQEQNDFRPPGGWYNFGLNLLAQARGMTILELPGWETSRGILIEMGYARGRGMPIDHMGWEEIQKMLDPETRGVLEQ